MGVGQILAEPNFPVLEFSDTLNFTFARNFVVSAVVFGGFRVGADPRGLRNSGKKDTTSPVSEPGVCFTGGMDQGGRASPVSLLGVLFTEKWIRVAMMI